MYFLDDNNPNIARDYEIRINPSKKEYALEILRKCLDTEHDTFLEHGSVPYKQRTNITKIDSCYPLPLFVETLQATKTNGDLKFKIKIRNKIQEKMVLQRKYVLFNCPFTSEFIIKCLSKEDEFSKKELIDELKLDEIASSYLNYLVSNCRHSNDQYRLSKLLEKSCVDKNNFITLCAALAQTPDLLEKFIDEFPDIRTFKEFYSCIDLIENEQKIVQIDEALQTANYIKSLCHIRVYHRIYSDTKQLDTLIKQTIENDNIVKQLKLIPNSKIKTSSQN